MAVIEGEGDSAGRRGKGRLHVLVVEDHADTAAVMKLSLEREGFAVRTVASYKEAIATASQWLPDVLVADVMLGGKDGLTVMRTMREAYPTLQGIVVSGKCRPEDRAQSLAAGFADHLCKPVEGHQLAEAIRRLVQAG